MGKNKNGELYYHNLNDIENEGSNLLGLQAIKVGIVPPKQKCCSCFNCWKILKGEYDNVEWFPDPNGDKC